MKRAAMLDGRLMMENARMIDFETMKVDEVYREGYDRGYNIASWNDLPEIGETIRKDLDWIGIGTIESKADALEAFEMLCHETESVNREYSPFEFTAHAINEREDSEEIWDAFDEGIAHGIRAYTESVADCYDDVEE